MATLPRALQMVVLSIELAWDQLRADPRFVCLTAFGVVVGTAVLVAAMGIATMAQERLSIIQEEIGTQVIFLSVGTTDGAAFRRKRARLIDEQALMDLGTSSGRFARQAVYLRGTAVLVDQGARSEASVLGVDMKDFPGLAMVLASGHLSGLEGCYLDAASVPLTTPRTLRLNQSRCVLKGTFRQAGVLRSMLNGESGGAVVTSFDTAYAMMAGQATLPTLTIALRVVDEADAIAALGDVGQFMQQRYPHVHYSVEWPGSRLMPLNQLLDQVRLVAVLVGALIMVISAVAMVNAMLAQIGQRRR